MEGLVGERALTCAAVAELLEAVGDPRRPHGFPEPDVWVAGLARVPLLRQRLQDEVERQIEKVAAEHPGWRGKDGFGGNISGEQADLLDIDVILWDYSSADQRKAITSNPVYKRLTVHSEGREVFEQESSALYDALSKTSVLSVPVALKLMAPRF